jgi:hypothetical protein
MPWTVGTGRSVLSKSRSSKAEHIAQPKGMVLTKGPPLCYIAAESL